MKFANGPPLPILENVDLFNTMDVKPVLFYTIFLIFLLYITLPTFYNPPQKSGKNMCLPDKQVSVSLWRHFVHHMFILKKAYLLRKARITWRM